MTPFLRYHNDAPLPQEVGANLHFRHAHENGNHFIVGNFSCEAKNVVGVSERCGIRSVFMKNVFLLGIMMSFYFRVNGPVAALVAETDLTLLIFGGGGIVLSFVFVLGGVFICRRYHGSMGGGVVKYNLQSTTLDSNPVCKPSGNGTGTHCKHTVTVKHPYFPLITVVKGQF